MMRTGRNQAGALKEIAAIRTLQKRAAEMDAVRAEAERREAADRHMAGRAAVDAAEQGWSAAVGSGAFELSDVWLHALGTRVAEARELSRAEDDAAEKAVLQARALRDATARSDAADERARTAARAAARRRDEARLAAVEDGLAARWRRA